jgi:uncharacterized protein (TIGR01319 family)
VRTLKDQIKIILATDCGSTTSKARLFRQIGDEYRFIESGEAPTTVEAPYENVTLGVRNAIREIEELTGQKILHPQGIIMPSNASNVGVDLYVTTSSAGGGLQMVVSGVVKTMTAESAERAALGAGGIVMDVLAIDDGRKDFEKINMLRFLRPDMILFAGGVDGGNSEELLETANFFKLAQPRPRLGLDFKIPVIYAGNKTVAAQVKNIIDDFASVEIVPNLRPTIDVEDPEPARQAVHASFMNHVMSHAPGYTDLMSWTDIPIMPTPAGEGMMFRVFAEAHNTNLIGVGLGGATTNIYSIYDDKFVRSVSANLGMSYSICNVLKEAGLDSILRWLPFDIDENDLLNRLSNKMIRPTIIPHTLENLMIEQAVAREALRLGFQHHKTLARPLIGVKRGLGIVDFEEQTKVRSEDTYIQMFNVQWVGGTGGLLSHAPRRAQSAIMLLDGFQLCGITRLFQDSVFMMPHLGVLSTIKRDAALEIFEKDCLILLGTAISFVGSADNEVKVADVHLTLPNNEVHEETVTYGTLKTIPLPVGETAEVQIHPTSNFDIGAGPNKPVSGTIDGGVVGIIIDARGRPLALPKNDAERKNKLVQWFTAMDLYPNLT